MSDQHGHAHVWPTEGVTYLAFSEFVALPHEADAVAFLDEVITDISYLVRRYGGALLGGETRFGERPPSWSAEGTGRA